MSRQVLYAKLQTPYFSPGSGDLGTVFPPAGKTLTDLVMNTSPEGLLVGFKYASRNQTILIPYANIVGLSLAPEVVVKTPSPAKAESTVKAK